MKMKIIGPSPQVFKSFFNDLDKAYNKAWKKTLRDSTRRITKEVKANAPVSKKGTHGGRPGDFKRSIGFKLGRYGLVSFVFATKKGKRTKASYIGHLIEYGTRSKKQDEGKLFAPAIEKEKPTLLENLKKATDKLKSGKDL